MEFTLEQAQALVDSFGGDNDAVITVISGDGHSGNGLYAGFPEYSYEGSTFLGAVK